MAWSVNFQLISTLRADIASKLNVNSAESSAVYFELRGTRASLYCDVTHTQALPVQARAQATGS